MDLFKNLYFVDIETASQHKSLADTPGQMAELWGKKSDLLRNPNELDDSDLYFERAGIFAEFGKVICISVGFVYLNENQEHTARVKAIYGDDEKAILEEFVQMVTTKTDEKYVRLCAHNGKEFDFPYMARRILINGLQLPAFLDIAGKKPWEIPHIDTMELWKFGDWKNYTSLELLASVFGIPSPKGDISGADVNRVYHEENDLPRIAKYCNRDVMTTIQVFLKLKSQAIIEEKNIEFVGE